MIRKIKASKIKDVTIPNDVIRKLILVVFCWFSKTERSLIERTGKTHGITFNINPPSKAIAK